MAVFIQGKGGGGVAHVGLHGFYIVPGPDRVHGISVPICYNRLLAKLGKAVKIADTSNQGKAKSKAASTVAVTLREDAKPFDKTDCVFNKDPLS